jgi:hypothetical protein
MKSVAANAVVRRDADLLPQVHCAVNNGEFDPDARLDPWFSLGAPQKASNPPRQVWCLNRAAPHNALI